MANARTRYDEIAEALVRRGATYGAIHGRACLMLGDAPFLQLANAGLAFRLFGRALAGALSLDGVRRHDPYDPSNRDAARPGWVFVPAAQHAAWDRLADEALHCAQLARVQRVSWTAPPLAAAAPAGAAPRDASRAPVAERAAAALERGFDFDLER